MPTRALPLTSPLYRTKSPTDQTAYTRDAPSTTADLRVREVPRGWSTRCRCGAATPSSTPGAAPASASPGRCRTLGPEGALVGVDAAPEMLELAAERVADRGWYNVVLVRARGNGGAAGRADHALFCAVHDIMQSGPALDNVLGAPPARAGVWRRVAASGVRSGPSA